MKSLVIGLTFAMVASVFAPAMSALSTVAIDKGDVYVVSVSGMT